MLNIRMRLKKILNLEILIRPTIRARKVKEEFKIFGKRGEVVQNLEEKLVMLLEDLMEKVSKFIWVKAYMKAISRMAVVMDLVEV